MQQVAAQGRATRHASRHGATPNPERLSYASRLACSSCFALPGLNQYRLLARARAAASPCCRCARYPLASNTLLPGHAPPCRPGLAHLSVTVLLPRLATCPLLPLPAAARPLPRLATPPSSATYLVVAALLRRDVARPCRLPGLLPLRFQTVLLANPGLPKPCLALVALGPVFLALMLSQATWPAGPGFLALPRAGLLSFAAHAPSLSSPRCRYALAALPANAGFLALLPLRSAFSAPCSPGLAAAALSPPLPCCCCGLALVPATSGSLVLLRAA